MTRGGGYDSELYCTGRVERFSRMNPFILLSATGRAEHFSRMNPFILLNNSTLPRLWAM